MTRATKRSHFIFPSNESKGWEKNFYDLAWSKNLQDKVIILVQILTKLETGEIKQIGYFVHNLTLADGRINYGTFTMPLLLPPISFRPLG